MVEHAPYALVGFGVGGFVMTVFWGKVVERMINKFYDEQKELVNRFYSEMQEQSDKFFSILKTYFQKEDDND